MSQSIIETAKAIVPHLPELLGEQAESVRQQLQAVLDKQADEAQIEIEIIDLLGEHEATRAWMNVRLQSGEEGVKGGTLGFDVLRGDRFSIPPGERGDVPGGRYYKCSNQQCDYRWTKTLDWQKPDDKCPECGFELIEDD